MRRTIIITAIAALISVAATAQNTFFPTQAGAVLTYVQKDAKGKVINYLRYTIKNVEGSELNGSVSYIVDVLDKNKKQTSDPIPLTVIIKDGVVFLDMKQLFVGMQTDQEFEVEFSGLPMELPAKLQPGQSIKDAEATMTINMGFMKMSTIIKMTDGKCVAIENITVAAGTFTCHQITQNITTTVMGNDYKSRGVSWQAPGVGVVKNETYNEKNVLQGSMELIELK